jgi:diguanylate cyclase (GGDEF)-like protein/PAS domain S-box-containing protein
VSWVGVRTLSAMGGTDRRREEHVDDVPRASRSTTLGTVLVGLGAVLIVLGGVRLAGWTDDRDAALDVLRAPHDDLAGAAALAVIADDGGLVGGLVAVVAGAVAAGAGAGLHGARARRRQARLALHPSLAAAADRKLEKVLAENAQDLVTMLDRAGRFTYVSPSVSAILGRDPAGMIGLRFGDVLEAVPDDGPREAGGPEGERRSHEPQRHRARHADGSVRWLETLSHRVDDDRAIGSVTLYSSRDITERVRLEETLVAERRMLGDTLANIHAGILSVDLDGVVIDANAELCAMVGFQPRPGDHIDAVESRYTMVGPDGTELAGHLLARALTGETAKQLAATIIGAGGVRREVLANAGPLVGADGHHTGAVLTLHDVSELRAAEAELRSLATVDALTGLPNRRALVTALSDALHRNVDTPERLALLFLDLDGFKSVNDTFGHDVGDQVLALVGTRLAGCMRGGDVVARLGGDEFVVVVERLTDPRDLGPLVQRIEGALATPFELPQATVTIGASVGVASGADASTAAELLALADRAMYSRKRERQGRARPVAAARA